MNDKPYESFVFYRSFRDAIEEMTAEDQLLTLLAICDYALYGLEPQLKGMPRAVFTVARPSIDANRKNRNNGKKGGRPKKETGGFENENRWFSKPESTETETEAETVTETVAVTETGAGEKGKTRGRFIPPSVEEVRGYCRERQNKVDPERFVSYYTANGWRVGRNPMKDWKATVRNWERNGYDDKGGQDKPESFGRLPGVKYC